MKSIEANFLHLEKRCPAHGLILLFAEVIRGKCYSEEAIVRNFNKLVPKSDYLASDKKGLIAWLVSVGKRPEDTQK